MLQNLLRAVPELSAFANLKLEIPFNKDSSRIGPADWSAHPSAMILNPGKPAHCTSSSTSWYAARVPGVNGARCFMKWLAHAYKERGIAAAAPFWARRLPAVFDARPPGPALLTRSVAHTGSGWPASCTARAMTTTPSSLCTALTPWRSRHLPCRCCSPASASRSCSQVCSRVSAHACMLLWGSLAWLYVLCAA